MSWHNDLRALGAFAAHPRSNPTYLSYLNGFAYGFGIELLQLAVPYRSFSTADLAANGAGILAAAVAWLLGPNTE